MVRRRSILSPGRRLALTVTAAAGLALITMALTEPLLTVRLQANAFIIPLVHGQSTIILAESLPRLFFDGHFALGTLLALLGVVLPVFCHLHALLLGVGGRGLTPAWRTAWPLLARVILLDLFVIALLVMVLTMEGIVTFQSHAGLNYLIGGSLLTLLQAHLLCR